MIHTLKDLAAEVSAAHDTPESVARRLYKDTDCGIGFSYSPPLNESYGSVSVAGYAEGVDAECPSHTLDFPFTAEDFWAAVKLADQEGCAMYDEAHD